MADRVARREDIVFCNEMIKREYKTCKSAEAFQSAVDTLYREKVIPAAKKGLCAAVITQVSDVKDEINGFLTYDRTVNKADTEKMLAIAEALRQTVK